jgi:hypothetical protein
MKTLISSLVCCLFIVFQMNAQDLFKPRGSFKMELMLPVEQGNKVFKDRMKGLFSGSAYYQHTLPFGLNFGVGGNMTYFQVNEAAFGGFLSGGITTFGGFGKIGFERFISSNTVVDFGVKGGYGTSFSNNNKIKESIGETHRFDAPYIEPVLSFFLMTDGASGVSFSLGYVFNGMKFNASHLMVDEITGYQPKDFGGITHYLVAGFGFTYYFGYAKESN